MYVRFTVKDNIHARWAYNDKLFSQKESSPTVITIADFNMWNNSFSKSSLIINLFITVGISKLALYQSEDCVQKVAVVWT